MKIVLNTKFGKGIKRKTNLARVREVSTDDTLPRKLLEMCPKKDPVNLLELKELSGQMGLGAIFAIDESKRLGLGSFKALGAAYVIAKMAVGESFEKKNSDFFEKAKRKLAGITFATSSAGNHGLSVAAGARLFGAESRIYVSVNVPEKFKRQLKDMGAKVTVHGSNYEQSQERAIQDCDLNGWTLISDSTWEGYDLGLDIMEGYLISIGQALEKIPENPTHIFLQAGVGGLAASFAAFIRKKLGNTPIIIVVEPSTAPCLQASIEKGEPSKIAGPVSEMGRLDCKFPSLHAFYSLSKTANAFVTITERESEFGNKFLSDKGIFISRSSSAGFVALRLLVKRKKFSLDRKSKVLCLFSEGLVE
ncbi:MAG: PLP-dependent lyase/thiolase [Rhodobacteraceae bacterium]|nr:MAG: PLP-dependent lyase/thiolase [Paracoccaceae bacterium]|tara:strand:- start:1227 stop:2315 length:1089 start_codon:yes stop_codon:yes gene_type:complete